MTGQDRFGFAVRLAGFDFETASPGELQTLREAFTAWFRNEPEDRAGLGTPILHPIEGPALLTYPESDFWALQQDTMRVLTMAVPGETAGAEWMQIPDIRIAQKLTPVPFSRLKGRSVLTVAGPARDVYLHMLIKLLSEGSDPVRRCPECDRWFVRQRRQKYCSITCTRKANMRVWLKSSNRDRSLQKRYRTLTAKERAAQKKRQAPAGRTSRGGSR